MEDRVKDNCRNNICENHNIGEDNCCAKYKKHYYKYCEQSANPVDAVVIPQEILDLVRALADMWNKTEEWRGEALKLPPEELRNFILLKWRVLQGISNQINTRKISKQPFEGKNVAKAIKWMLEKAV
jgi:hypothetical protein